MARRRGRPVFAIAEAAPAIRDRLVADDMEVVPLEISAGSEDDAARVTELAERYAADWVVVDGYQFGGDYQRRLKAAGLKLLFVDDDGQAGHYYADLVLNQNAHAHEELYENREPYTRLLLGLRYAMLRREFTRWRGWKREIAPVARKILVTMGGSDPDNISALVIEALQSLPDKEIEATVAVGGGNPRFDSLRKTAKSLEVNVRLEKDVSNMPELMAGADVAVSAAGSTCWELCLLGLPAILIDLAENQRQSAAELDRRGAAIYLGSSSVVTPTAIATKLQHLLLSVETRVAMSHRSRQLIDGRGAGRVVSSLESAQFRIRRVEEKDCLLLWEWANHPSVRSVSFSREPIPLDAHIQWFRSKLASRNARLSLITDSHDLPIGEVRYEIEGARAVVSICLGPHSRGKGYGKAILEMATEELFRSSNVTALDAYVKPGNEASLRLFSCAGFTNDGSHQVSGQDAVHFVLTRNGVR